MKGWEEYMILHSGERYIFDYGFHFGDWLAFAEYMSYYYNAPDYGYAGANTDKDLLATSYFYYTTGLMSKIATILGKSDDAKKYAGILPKIKTAFAKEFLSQTGRLTSNTQAAYVVALSLGLIPDDKKATASERLANDVKHFGHLTTGFLGTPLICKALSDNGHPELAYMLLFNKKYPSWLYPVLQGATTIWERWDGQKPDGSFQDKGMNSFNHYAYGAIGEWLYQHVAGIKIDENHPGYKHILLAPHPGGGLKNASAEITTLYGKASSSWKFENDDFVYEVVIPANTSATVSLPFAKAEQVMLDGVALKAGFVQNKTDLQVNLGSGKYLLKYPAQALNAAIAEKKK
jgi:alpha-L-rhamnosidase